MTLANLSRRELLDADAVPHRALRETELTLKRRLFRLEDAAVKALETRYKAVYGAWRDAMGAEAERRGLTALAPDRTSQGWRAAFMDRVTGDVERLIDQTAADGLRYATQAYQLGYAGKLWQLDMATRRDVRIKTPRVPDMLALQRTAALIREDEYDDAITRLLGQEWRAQYADELDDIVTGVRRALGQSMIQGEGVPAAMRRVRDVLGVETDRRRTGASYRANFNRVQAITRTVINKVSNDGAVEAYRANADIIDRYEWITANDERTCPDCDALNGRTYAIDDSDRPPLHPNCRCTVVPVIRADAMTNGEDPPRQTFDAWQRGALGTDARIGQLAQVTGPLPAPDWVARRAAQQAPLDVLQRAAGAYRPARKTGVSSYDMLDAPLPGADGPGDPIMRRMLDENGMDALPAVVNEAEMNQLLDQGWREMYRGVTDEVYFEQYKSGPLFAGNGMHGNGTYVTEVGSALRREDAQFIARHYAGQSPGGAVARMALNPNARVIEINDLIRLQGEVIDNLGWQLRDARNAGNIEEVLRLERAMQVAGEKGRLAMANGYDAIRAPVDGYVVVLNRSAVAVQEDNVLSTLRGGK